MAADENEAAIFTSSPPYDPSSSPPNASRPSNLHITKPKKPPPITPKRFTRFFTPRTSSSRTSRANSNRSGRQLKDITHAALNRRGVARAIGANAARKTVLFDENVVQSIEPASTPEVGSNRKRKAPYTPPDSSPIQVTPSKRSKLDHSTLDFQILEDEKELHKAPLAPVRRARGPHLRILERSFGGLAISRGRPRDHCTEGVEQTANFYSTPADRYKMSHLPFCSVSCNTNSLVAIGDEEGWVRLMDTARDSKSDFSKPHLLFQPHAANAIMDMAFSSDDLLLATASGDQTAQIVDVRTQSAVFALCKHTSSVKQICFQPGNDKVIATSSRDGTVQLWDLRCSGASVSGRSVLGDTVTYATTFNSISSAHADREKGAVSGKSENSGLANFHNALRDVPSKGETPSRRGEASVTSLQFLPAELGREHLLLTASDGSTTVKLWDVRARYSRRGAPVALSSTVQPESHSRHRHFGITSLVLSGDSARLYALSRDNTVYAYSTNHLIMGHAPELSTPAPRHKHNSTERPGLGPLYGFRHPQFHCTTFYVKAALSKAKDDKPEMLAVGSSDGCPVLFPTDEALFRRRRSEDENENPSDDAIPISSPFPFSPIAGCDSSRPFLRRTASISALSSGLSARLQDTIPIYSHGTPLVRGHDGEVTSVCWSTDGELVSVSDDFSVRCWRESERFKRDPVAGGNGGNTELGPRSARELRKAGEGGGRRWGCGWAELGDMVSWDDEDW